MNIKSGDIYYNPEWDFIFEVLNVERLGCFCLESIKVNDWIWSKSTSILKRKYIMEECVRVGKL